MRSFLKIVFGSCLGSILAILFLFIIILTIGLISSSGKNSIQKNAVLLLDFDGLLPEKTNNVSQSSQFNFSPQSAIGSYDLVKLIKKAATDDKISQIVIKSESSSMGFVTMRHLADALDSLRETTDKTVYAFGDFFTQSGYILASEADSIFLNPQGRVDLRGFGVMQSFSKDFLEKLGIKMNVFYAGEYKSAAEAYYRNDMSEKAKTQTREYLNSLHQSFVDIICENRGLEKSEVNQGINNYSYSYGETALESGIVDGLLQWFQFEDRLRKNMGLESGTPINYISIKDYRKKTSLLDDKKIENDKIAVIYAEGEIHYNNEDNGLISEKLYHEVFDEVRSNDDIKAVVVRINSPGGSSFTSETILQELNQIKAEGKPVIASFGNYAASGGYYIACQADEILAEPNTLTGSIGAFSVFPDASKMFEDKLGVHFDTVKTSKFASAFVPAMGMTQAEKDFIDHSNKRIYQTFISHVAKGRNMEYEDVEKVAQGRIWTGPKAVELNLVDRIGNLDEAIAVAAEKAGLESYSTKEYPSIQTPPWAEFIEGLSGGNVSILSELKDNPLSAEIITLKKRLKFYTENKTPLVLLPIKVSY